MTRAVGRRLGVCAASRARVSGSFCVHRNRVQLPSSGRVPGRGTPWAMSSTVESCGHLRPVRQLGPAALDGHLLREAFRCVWPPGRRHPRAVLLPRVSSASVPSPPPPPRPDELGSSRRLLRAWHPGSDVGSSADSPPSGLRGLLCVWSFLQRPLCCAGPTRNSANKSLQEMWVCRVDTSVGLQTFPGGLEPSCFRWHPHFRTRKDVVRV